MPDTDTKLGQGITPEKTPIGRRRFIGWVGTMTVGVAAYSCGIQPKSPDRVEPPKTENTDNNTTDTNPGETVKSPEEQRLEIVRSLGLGIVGLLVDSEGNDKLPYSTKFSGGYNNSYHTLRIETTGDKETVPRVILTLDSPKTPTAEDSGYISIMVEGADGDTVRRIVVSLPVSTKVRDELIRAAEEGSSPDTGIFANALEQLSPESSVDISLMQGTQGGGNLAFELGGHDDKTPTLTDTSSTELTKMLDKYKRTLGITK